MANCRSPAEADTSHIENGTCHSTIGRLTLYQFSHPAYSKSAVLADAPTNKPAYTRADMHCVGKVRYPLKTAFKSTVATPGAAQKRIQRPERTSSETLEKSEYSSQEKRLPRLSNREQRQ